MKTKRHLLSVILAVVTVMGCEDSVGPAIGGGVIDAEDVSFNAELTVDTPMVFNEGHLVVTLTTNRQQIIIASIFSEFKFGDIRPGTPYDVNKSLSFSSDIAEIKQDGEGSITLIVVDPITNTSKELTATYQKTTEYEIKPQSISLSKTNLSISMNEECELTYSINPVQAHCNLLVKKEGIYGADLSYEIDAENSKIYLKGGSQGGKERLKIYSVADTNVCAYVDVYVKHRVALELDIKSTGSSMYVFWREMPIQATARLVTWSGEINDNFDISTITFKEFTLPTQYKASFYVNINSSQVGWNNIYFFGCNEKYKWNTSITWGANSGQYSQWGESHNAIHWSYWKHIKDTPRVSTYRSTKNLVEELNTDQPGYRALNDLLVNLQNHNENRWTSNNGKTGENFNNGWWNENVRWKLYYITVEDIVYDKDKLDMEYVFHRYRTKVNGTFFSGAYYWHAVDNGSWAIKLEDKQ